jgi:hypothetical protein
MLIGSVFNLVQRRTLDADLWRVIGQSLAAV